MREVIMLSLRWMLSLRHLRRRAGRTALVVASVALGVAAWTATRALDQSLAQAFRTAATPIAGAADLYVTNGDPGVRRELAGRLERVPGVRTVQPVLIQRVRLPGHGGRQVLLLGVDLARRQADAASSGIRVGGLGLAGYVRARLLGQKPVLVGRELNQALSRSPTIDVMVAGRPHRLARVGSIEASGSAAALAGNVLVLDDRDAAALVGRPGTASRLDLALEPDADREAVRRRVATELAGAATVSTPEAQDQRVLDVLAGLNVGFSLCGMGALALGLFLIYNILSVSMVERQREIGILRSVGASEAQAASVYLGEAAALGLVGAVLGVPLGLGLAWVSLGPMQRAMSDLFLPLAVRSPDFSTATALGGVAAGVITVLLAALVPTLQATRTSPIAAMHRGSARQGSRVPSLLAAAGAILVALGLALSMLGRVLPARLVTYAVLVLVLAGTLLAVPAATSVLARQMRGVMQIMFGVAGRLAADQLVASPSRTGLTVAALAAAVGLVLQTGGVIHGNEDAVRAWVDRGVAGDLFITSGGPLSASGQLQPMPENLTERLRAEVPGARIVPMRFRYLNWSHEGRGNRLLMLAIDAQAYYQANQARNPRLADLELFEQLSQPGTVVVSDNFAVLHHIRVGDRIELPGRDGPIPLKVVGQIPDFSCSRGTVLVDRAQFAQAFGAEQVDVFSLFLPGAGNVSSERERLLRAPGAAEHALCALTRAEMRAHILGMIHRIYAVAYVQELVAATVAALGVLSALIISVLQRRRELGLLRSVGATPAQVLTIVLGEALLMVVISLALGLVIGLSLEWYILRVILFTETGFVFPVRFPWLLAGLISVVVLLIGLLAGLGPGVQATRLRIAEAIAYE